MCACARQRQYAKQSSHGSNEHIFPTLVDIVQRTRIHSNFTNFEIEAHAHDLRPPSCIVLSVRSKCVFPVRERRTRLARGITSMSLKLSDKGVPVHSTESSDCMRERLLEIALEVICEQGLENVSIGRISKRAFVSRSTFYRYFDSKAAFTRKVVELHEIRAIKAGLRLAAITPGDKNALNSWLDSFHDTYELTLTGLVSKDSYHAATLEYKRVFQRIAAKLIERWERQGWVAAAPHAVEQLLLIYTMVSSWSAHRFAFSEDSTTLSRAALVEIVSRELASIFAPKTLLDHVPAQAQHPMAKQLLARAV